MDNFHIENKHEGVCHRCELITRGMPLVINSLIPVSFYNTGCALFSSFNTKSIYKLKKISYNNKAMAVVVKLVNTLDCGSSTRGFESRQSPH